MMTSAPGTDGLFGLIALPARLIGAGRADVARAVREDAGLFRGRNLLLGVLALVAVGYPIAASVPHATFGVQPEASQVEYALTPWITFVYAESLPFLIAMAVLGAFSPALGMLALAVFVPADLTATALSMSPPNQLSPLVPAVGARFVSYALLWVAVVELPLRARTWAGGNERREAVVTLLLVGLWAYSLVYLVQPVVMWTVHAGLIPLRITAATIHFAWAVALAAAAAAFIAARLRVPRDASAGNAGHEATPEPGVEVSAVGTSLGRELAKIAALAILLSGVMQGWLEAVLIIGGLVLGGPVMTAILPRVRLPRLIAAMSPISRWLSALIITFGVTWMVTAVAPEETVPDYLLIAALIGTAIPVFRLLAEAGSDTGASRPARSTAAAVSSIAIRVLAVLALSFAFPAMAAADDVNEKGTAKSNPIPTGALVGGAAGGAAGAMYGSKKKAGPKLQDFDQKQQEDAEKAEQEQEASKDNEFSWFKPRTWFQ